MEKEINELKEKGVCSITNRNLLSPHIKTINALWAFKIKLFPSGEINKYKSHLCVRGDQQKEDHIEVDYYSPVVSCTAVRLLFCLKLIYRWEGRQIDYVNTFCQAPLDDPIYMNIPRGMKIKENGQIQDNRDYVLKLNKSLYGLCQSSKTWFEHLKKGLLASNLKNYV